MADQIVPFRSGSCLCRGVSFRVTGQPLRVGICHCSDCRKTSGSTFSAFAVWPREAFEQMTGTTGTYSGRSFCLTCGGRVTSVRDDEVEIMMGSLDEIPTGLTPEHELWVGRRESWLSPVQSATQFETERELREAASEPPAEPEAEASN